jgi:hypothetical protein
MYLGVPREVVGHPREKCLEWNLLASIVRYHVLRNIFIQLIDFKH